MAFDFPNTPTLNQKYQPGGSAPTYTWDGEKWTTLGGSVGNVGAVRYDLAQGLNTTQQAQGAANISSVAYAPQILTAPQQTQARQNVFAAPIDAMAYNGIQANGSFEVNQPSSNSGSYFVDGWALQRSLATGVLAAGVYDATGYFPGGLPKCFAQTVGTPQASLAPTEYSMLMHIIEGIRASRLGWGTPDAAPLTIAFWSAHAVPGLYGVSVRNITSDRSYVSPYTHAVANVAQYNVITVPGPTTGTWVKDTGASIVIDFCFGAGTTYTAPSINSWLNSNYVTVPGQVNAFATVANSRIAGVLFLPGSDAPSAARSSLIMRPADQELLLCRRYFVSETYAPGGLWCNPIDLTSIYRRAQYKFNPPMRIAPVMKLTGAASGSAFAAGMPQVINSTPYMAELQGDLAGAGYSYISSLVADARL